MVRKFLVLMLVVVVLGLGAKAPLSWAEVAEDGHVVSVTTLHSAEAVQVDGDHCGHLTAHLLAALSGDDAAEFDIHGRQVLAQSWAAFYPSRDPTPPYRPPLFG